MEAFKEYFTTAWGAEATAALLRGLDEEPSVSIRLNPRRLPLTAEPEGTDGRVPWCEAGIYLATRPAFTADPLMHAGAYYVQEASSMFIGRILETLPATTFDVTTGATGLCLDLCAAPGGKSTLLRSMLPDECLLVSNEPLRARAQVLAENLAKWGHPHVVVTQAYAADIAQVITTHRQLCGQGCDLILADVPCSGEGMMRKEAEAVRQWSPTFVKECAALQRSIVRDIWPALRPGGYLIYSTCTFNPEEDEQNVEWIAQALGAEIIPLKHPVDGVTATGLHFIPGQVRGEGFFCALVRKPQEANDSCLDAFIQGEKRKEKKGKDKKGKGKQAAATTVEELLRQELPTLPTDQLDEPLAPRVELSLAESIRYLQRESLTLPEGTPRGHVQVCYRGQRLGLMNNLGQRANNLYPKEWRIRSGYVEPHCIFDEVASGQKEEGD